MSEQGAPVKARGPRGTARFVSACGLVAFAVCALAIAARAQQAAPSVGTAYAERKPIAQSADFVGRVAAVDKVEITARVTGYLEKVLFKEGDFVKQGDPLYRIEQEPYKAAVEQAEAALVRSNAAKILTAVQLKRAEELLALKSGTEVTRDQARAADEQAKGAILADQAALDLAKINLGYTDILSPISGKISKTNITVGNVVGPNSGPLTLVVSQDPMYVTFPVSQRDLLQLEQNGRKQEINSVKIKLRFANGTIYDQVGSVNFLDVSVDRSTDTVLVRATMPNPAGLLIDGQLVTVMVVSGTPEEQVLVPQAAVIADQEGLYVFAVEDGKAVVKRIKTGGVSGPNVIVADGLKGGEQIIVEGLQSVRPGQAVQASPVQSSLNPS
jgi:membrane fusion protein, multidrug efflux system